MQATVETVDAPSAWRSESLGDESNWRITLDENQREELHAQVLRSAAAGTDTLSIKPGDISLPSLQTMLQSIPSRLEGGLGFFVLSGLPVSDSMTNRICVFCGPWGSTSASLNRKIRLAR